MIRPIPAGDYVEHFDPELPHHRAWLLAVLEQLVAHEPQALEEGGTLRRLWTERQEIGPTAPPPSAAPPAITANRGNRLSVPWFAQLDSATDQARRMCFSSSCAMLLAFLRPGVLTRSNGDDQYLARVRRFGDTTDAAAQIRALASYGIKARFTSEASFATLEGQIVVGIPDPINFDQSLKVHLAAAEHRQPLADGVVFQAGQGHHPVATPRRFTVHGRLPGFHHVAAGAGPDD
jgi:hypothetical protein